MGIHPNHNDVCLDDAALADLDINGLRLRMEVLMVKVWPDSKCRQRYMACEDGFGGANYYHSVKLTAVPGRLWFFRVPCRLMVTNHSTKNQLGIRTYRSGGVIQLRLHTGGPQSAFGVFPFRPRRINGYVGIPIPEFLVEARQEAMMHMAVSHHQRRLAAIVEFIS